MDARPDPKIRHVGFFTPPPVADSLPSNPRPSSTSITSVPVPVPPGRRNVFDDHLVVVGSYDASEPILGSVESSSKIEDGDEVSQDSSFGWFPRNDSDKFLTSGRMEGDDMHLSNQSQIVNEDTSNLNADYDTNVAGVTKGAFVEHMPEQSDKPGKEKTKKAERCALQESQRTTKGVAKGTSELKADVPTKPKMTKSERRALQEAQRAAKASLRGEENKPAASAVREQIITKSTKQLTHKKDITQILSLPGFEKKIGDRFTEKERKKDVPPPRMQFDDISRVEKSKRRSLVKQTETRNRVELFRHLPQYDYGTQLRDLESRFFKLDHMHPAVYKIGLQYMAGDISGSNARCKVMLQAFREVINDYSTPPNKNLTRDLAAKISNYVSFLSECRPISISMGNAIRFLKNCIAALPLTTSETEAKDILCSDIDRFISEKILLAGKVIVGHANNKINDGDVLLTYGASCVVEMLLVHAHELGKRFRIIIVDSRPKCEGLLLLRRLVSKGLNCTYTHINAVSYIMHEVTCVFLGAASVFCNGTLYSKVGTACVAMVAHAFRVPVLVCCESYKFHERVQLDSICFNELGDPHDILKVQGRKDVSCLTGEVDKEKLQLLNVKYDVTPIDYITLIITDYGMVPPTSIPVIVREYRKVGVWM